MKINDTVKRQDGPTKKWSQPILLDTQKKLEHHRELQAAGVKYIVLHEPKANEECESCSA